MSTRTAVIIGAGPAGLTAAYELLQRSDIQPVVLERDEVLGGIARTVQYKGNRMDIGGHRFFSKSDRVMNWWFHILPLEAQAGEGGENTVTIAYQRSARDIAGMPTTDARTTDKVMLVRPRKSRIYFLRRFFDYPITLSRNTLVNLGAWRTVKIAFSYARALLFPIRDERNLEQFFVNRFGRELYLTFFKSYTQKVWGIPCDEISAEWGRQRIKGLSILKTLTHIAKKMGGRQAGGVRQSQVETSLIERFMYPKLGPGQMWEEVARQIEAKGGTIVYHQEVETIRWEGSRVRSVTAIDRATGARTEYRGDYFFSTMAVQDLVRAAEPPPPEEVRRVSDGLMYRDFITVGMLVSKLKVKEGDLPGERLLSDNWIYIQEPDVQIGRLQIFNNWSPALVADPDKVWLGLEYFCYTTDEIWRLPDDRMIALAASELDKIGIIDKADVLDATVVRVPKTYPAYFGTYDRFGVVRNWLDSLENLFPVGRNGMHKYNNQDHSMLTAMTAVDNILEGRTDKSNLWSVNTEDEYHEEKKAV
jgi:protoporphyrinogen oxidase